MALGNLNVLYFMQKESPPGGKVGETKYVHVKVRIVQYSGQCCVTAVVLCHVQITDGSVEEEEREETEIKQQLVQ